MGDEGTAPAGADEGSVTLGAGEGPAPRLLECFPDALAAADALRARAWRVAVGESCTGGLLGAALTAVPGSSAYMLGGVIAYDNAVKIELLDVPADVLARHGAVSEEVAAAMARGARDRLGADVGVSVTGVAGPGADEGGKPAGLVFVAAATATAERLVQIDGDRGREGNRVAAVRAALRLLVELV
jgi:PncC family amidohydrolase